MQTHENGYQFLPMKLEYANEIAYNWKYKGEYSFYDMTEDDEDLTEFLDSKKWDKIFATFCIDRNVLLGFSTYHFENNFMWIGFGLKPIYTGIGMGELFVRSAIEFGINHFDYKESKILLSVAEFNKRAICLYERVGFQHIEKKEIFANGELRPFLVMGKPI